MLCFRLCRLNSRYPSHQIIHKLFNTLVDLSNGISKESIQTSVALILGIIHALLDSKIIIDEEFTSCFTKVLPLILSQESLLKIHKAANSVECSSGNVPRYPEESHDCIFLL